jgi:hypothetical protein
MASIETQVLSIFVQNELPHLISDMNDANIRKTNILMDYLIMREHFRNAETILSDIRTRYKQINDNDKDLSKPKVDDYTRSLVEYQLECQEEKVTKLKDISDSYTPMLRKDYNETLEEVDSIRTLLAFVEKKSFN